MPGSYDNGGGRRLADASESEHRAEELLAFYAQNAADELEEAFGAIADGLAAIDFYKARKPEAVMRTLRTIISRAEPDLRETRLLAAVGFEIGNYLRRNGFARADADASNPEEIGQP